MRAVNLLAGDRKQVAGAPGGSARGGGGALTTRRVAIVAGSVAAIVAGFVGVSFVGARGDVAKQRDALAAVQQQVADAQALADARRQKQQAPAVALPASVEAQLAAFDMVASARIQWDQLLSDVSRVIPSDSWLSSLTLQGAPAVSADPGAAVGTSAPSATASAPSAAPTGFVASGFALSHETAARLLRQLALVPMLSDITLQRDQKAPVGADKAFQFTLSANVRLDGAS